MNDVRITEYQALRATIRERGSVRIFSVLLGFLAWAALTVAVLITDLDGAVALVPLLALAVTFEVSFFIHTGVERIGRYVQVFFEESSAFQGWETTAMSYGRSFQGGLDPLFVTIFALSSLLNFFCTLPVANAKPGWILVSILGHLAFAYRLVTAKKKAATQRGIDLERFQRLKSSEPAGPSN